MVEEDSGCKQVDGRDTLVDCWANMCPDGRECWSSPWFGYRRGAGYKDLGVQHSVAVGRRNVFGKDRRHNLLDVDAEKEVDYYGSFEDSNHTMASSCELSIIRSASSYRNTSIRQDKRVPRTL